MYLRKSFSVLLAVVILMGLSNSVFAHCEIPCGIYGDKMRFDMWEEQITTIEKSMNQINTLSKEDPINYNQLVRWVTNKEKHANDVIEIAYQYFLTQRIKPLANHDDTEAATKYAHQLGALHEIIFYSMKAKQTTDLENVNKLRELVKSFYKLYFDEEMEDHLEEHAH